jgi:hypothetical protein
MPDYVRMAEKWPFLISIPVMTVLSGAWASWSAIFFSDFVGYLFSFCFMRA